MKNPLKSAGDKIRNFTQKFRTPKKPGETPKMIVDGLGDSGIIGGLALLGTAAFLPASPTVMLLAGGAFVVAGAGAKFAAAKMAPDAFDVTAPAKMTPADHPPAKMPSRIAQLFKQSQKPRVKNPAPAAPKPPTLNPV